MYRNVKEALNKRDAHIYTTGSKKCQVPLDARYTEEDETRPAPPGRSPAPPVTSDEGDARAGLVHLPHVELLVLLQRLLELGGREAPRDAALLRFGHADHAAAAGPPAARPALRGELAHQGEDDVGRALSPGEGIQRVCVSPESVNVENGA